MALLSKLARAISAYLISEGCGSVDDILPYHSALKKRPLPNTTIDFLTVANPEPELTGNNRVTVAIIIRSSTSLPVGEPNSDAPWVAHNARIDSHRAALMKTSDNCTLRATATAINEAGRDLATDHELDESETQRAANNADMVNFTLIEIHDAGLGTGKADEGGNYYEDVLLFSCLACESNVD